MFCMVCGSEISNHAKFCTSCGSPAPCIPNASADEQADSDEPARFTEYVGNPDSVKPADNSTTTSEQLTFPEAMDRQKHRSHIRIHVLVLAALVALALSAVAYAAHTIYRYYVEEVNPPITTVEELTAAFDEKDANRAIACMDENTRNKYDSTFSLIDSAANSIGLAVPDGASRAVFESLVKDLFPNLSSFAGENIDYHVSIADSSQSIDGNSAFVSGTWRFELISDNKTIIQEEPFAFNLVLERGTWRILYDDTFKSNVG
ncbi:zinc ribbon domain-containing protein [Adlercreutzia sp. ZJ141]|uniref:zinc ribbon domain-containing protein n=1 Tax=Adlercreutzia sp. ZJ141 TaxID=2709406 RepID=UPI0013EAF818|nr:zinc ribbon domain-containing protein [Adlercreutzia sp. ZJ141]